MTRATVSFWTEKFSVVTVAAFDRIARSTKNFLEIVDELNELGIEFISAREAIDTSGPMGRMFITLIRSIAELERSLIVEHIKAGMRTVRMEGQRLGRAPLNIDRLAIVHDRLLGMSMETRKTVLLLMLESRAVWIVALRPSVWDFFGRVRDENSRPDRECLMSVQ
jgi:DNA invertase Pin-like site-specific DNA recombinase